MTAEATPANPGVAQISTLRTLTRGATVLHQTDGTLALSFDNVEDYPFRLTAAGEPAHHPAPTEEELRAFTARFCAAVIEVMAGDRGPAQLLHCTTPEIYEELVRRGNALAQVAGADQRRHRPRPRIRSVHVACPSTGIAEFSIHVRHGERSRAVAGRLAWRRGAWLCVALQFG